ncbi:glycosyltransferase [Glaciibacter psychrotolerans]|uniref:GT2 family glycosyltransferase n=1 Tax=Glaciibacter psychrotolerans TaxID=670054 RepID=A0A7Z0J758_9MICO|nr:GT2 family glycosyltransferase [Leifsonia psychrotolerans]
MTKTNPVTVVIPIYGDLPGLLACIAAVTSSVDLTHHSLLLVNDCGPDAENIERAVLSAVSGTPGVRYERNSRNLGFVGNCNRAALELDDSTNDILLLNSDTIVTPGFLDEMTAVLHAAPEHGIVCARSNNATIASLPYRLRRPGAKRTAERTTEVYAGVVNELPAFSVAPVAMGFCFLIRRELIVRFGLFDEIFSPGYGEENDFCLRMREHGYLSLISHRALVFHAVGQSFPSEQRMQLRAAHERILVGRHPTYTQSVQSYLKRTADPVDVFADAIVPSDDVVRLLIDCEGAPVGLAANLLRAANDASHLNAQVTVSVPPRLGGLIRSAYPNLSVVDPDHLSGIWDVAVTVTADPAPLQRDRLTRASPRVVVIGGEEQYEQWSVAVLPSDGWDGTSLLQTLCHDYGRAAIDFGLLRKRWSDNADDAMRLAIPLVAPTRLRSRVVQALERNTPALATIMRKVLRH